MAQDAARATEAPDEFSRLHRVFVEHLGLAVGLVWIASAVAACMAPWTRNIRGLIDPLGRTESTWSFLFGLPLVMTLGWVCVACGAQQLRRATLLRSPALEFAVAGLAAFAVFCLAVGRIATAISLGA